MQQVNLYLKEFRPKFDLFAARNLILLAGVYIFGLTMWSVSSYGSVNRLQKEGETIIAEIKAEETKLARLKGFGKPGDKSQMEETVAQMRSAIDNRIYIKQLIGNNSFGNDQGFSKVLTALSKASVKDLNLNEFGLSNGGRELFLQGKTVRIDAVPEYIKTFQQDPAMANVSLGILRLVKTSDRHLEFKVGEWDEKNIASFDAGSNLEAAASSQGR